MNNNDNGDVPLSRILIALVVAAVVIAAFMFPTPAQSVPTIEPAEVPHFTEEAHAAEVEVYEPKQTASVIEALVTGYNTVPEQTDSTPCIAATGDDICGRSDVVACPTAYPFGTQVMIDGATYVCLDRTAGKYDGRWDISCDKDMECPARVHGYKEVHIIRFSN